MFLTRRRLTLGAAACLGTGLSALAGCAGDPPKPAATPAPPPDSGTSVVRYTETISSLLISQDRKNIVVIGSGYHYIFDAPPGLLALLASPLHARSKGNLSSFRVDAKGKIRGHYTLQIDNLITPSEQDAARSMGFIRGADPANPEAHVLRGELVGQRYLQSTLVSARATEKLNQRYVIEVTAEQSTGDRVAGALSTPVTVATDGVLLLYTIVLSPIVVPLVVLTREKKN
ncbi:hypothetical protein LRH25_26405 [Ideonella azotifigens]|uniref:5-formyltetrahydrofolate cyclo-ligase n=1 Tax=Ideonella azotifigens TaxID=513160 RepID=A0ABN1K2M0_9BURK|nr:hypothetical protein [Ideonella azotifigens]MCD2343861.1 hypothetical protein [Ideonella azotifigens]